MAGQLNRTFALILTSVTVVAPSPSAGETNLSKHSLRSMLAGNQRIERAYIEGSKTIAMKAWLPHSSYPCANLSEYF